MSDNPEKFDVQRIIDEQPVSTFQKRIVAICATIAAVDGFDTVVIGFLAPSIRDEWNAGATQLTLVMMAGLAGLLCGSFVFGPLADRIGRRRVMLTTCGLFGLMCLASAFAGSITDLALLRFLTGIGLGGALPNAITLCSEYCPARQRASLVTLMVCGFTVGMAVSGIVSGIVLAQWGWRAVLIVGGLAPVVLLPLIWWALPESAKFLALGGNQDAKLATILVRIMPNLPEGAMFATPSVTGSVPALQIFTGTMRAGTLLLWLSAFMSLLIIYLIGNWLPLLLTDGGYEKSQAAFLATAFHIGGTVGGLALGQLMDRYEERKVLGWSYLLTCPFIGLMMMIGSDNGILAAIAILGIGFCISGGQVGLQALASGFYPPEMRGTGVSWMNGIGRSGSVVGSMAGGAALAFGMGAAGIIGLLVVPAAISGTAILAIRKARDQG